MSGYGDFVDAVMNYGEVLANRDRIQRLRVPLNNGVTMSIISGGGTYGDGVNTFEVGILDRDDELIAWPEFAPDYYECDLDEDGGVYRRVPVDLIREYVERIGWTGSNELPAALQRKAIGPSS